MKLILDKWIIFIWKTLIVIIKSSLLFTVVIKYCNLQWCLLVIVYLWFFIVNQIVPPVNITILTSDEQIVGQPLTLECRIGAARGIDSTFDIIWTEQRTFTEVRSVKDIPGSLLSNYSDFYTIPILSRNDFLNSFSCEIIINLINQSLSTNARIVLENVIGKFWKITIIC